MDRTRISGSEAAGGPRSEPGGEAHRPEFLIIALALVFYGLWKAAFVPAMFVGHTALLLAIGFLAQVVLAVAAAVGVWLAQPWASLALILLGASIAATYLVEAFVLGIVAYLYALFASVVALVVTFLLAAWVDGAPSPRR